MLQLPTSSVRRKLARTMLATVGDWKLIEEGDRILVAVSGGKDSYTMLDLLRQAQRRSPVGYEIVAFRAYGATGQSVYHTNVLMCLGAKFASAGGGPPAASS